MPARQKFSDGCRKASGPRRVAEKNLDPSMD
jgi:hypothetical protein